MFCSPARASETLTSHTARLILDGIQCLGSKKRRLRCGRRRESRTTRAALNQFGPRGKASLLTLVRECLRIQCGSSLPDFLNN